MARHIPERCLRQYGYVQDIPRPIPTIPSEGTDSWFYRNILSFARAIRDHAEEVQFSAVCVDGYLGWYLTVSHPHIISPRQYGDDVGHSHVRSSHDGSSHADVVVPSDDMALPPHDADNAQRLQIIVFIMDIFMGLVNPYDEVYSLTVQATHIAHKGPI